MRERYLADIRRYQRERETGVIIGVRGICAYTKIGPHKLADLIEHHSFPATRLPDGRWCTSKRLIDEWIIQRWKEGKTANKNPMERSDS